MVLNDKYSRLPLPRARCLNKSQAADYLGIGITLLTQVGPSPIKIGRRCVYDVVDLDVWFDEYKHRGRARKEVIWPEKEDSTVVKTRRTGGSMSFSQTETEYVKALGL
ncbi:MAG: hypothetical protein KAU29_10030, partial [Gammaproteobacteria bacterium]|nr:hypothetical protein [Gammaproteobacteria bacterium]